MYSQCSPKQRFVIAVFILSHSQLIQKDVVVFGVLVEDPLRVGELEELADEPPHPGVDRRLGREVHQVVFFQLLDGLSNLAIVK